MTWTIGGRTVIGCGCVAVVEWRAPNVPSLDAVRIHSGVCGAPRHTAGRRILASPQSPERHRVVFEVEHPHD
jgi:hypothetical protein